MRKILPFVLAISYLVVVVGCGKNAPGRTLYVFNNSDRKLILSVDQTKDSVAVFDNKEIQAGGTVSGTVPMAEIDILVMDPDYKPTAYDYHIDVAKLGEQDVMYFDGTGTTAYASANIAYLYESDNTTIHAFVGDKKATAADLALKVYPPMKPFVIGYSVGMPGEALPKELGSLTEHRVLVPVANANLTEAEQVEFVDQYLHKLERK
jgi:hypothetical protein